MAYELPSLPYDYTALKPAISQQRGFICWGNPSISRTQSTLEFHHDKHHAAYVNKHNDGVQGTELDSEPVDALGFEPLAKLASNDSLNIDDATLTQQLSPEEQEKLTKAVTGLGHVGEGHCAVIQ